MNDYGYFPGAGAEFVVTTPDTPRAYDNFLWNDAIFSNVQQTGVGYCDYQIDDTEAVQLLTGVGRICDFDVFGRDHLMSRLLYIRDQDTADFWNLNWEPVRHPYESFQCTHGLGWSQISSVTEGIASELFLFVPPGNDPVEMWKVTLINKSDTIRHLTLFAYCQFQLKFKWGFDSYGDMIFRNALHVPHLNAVIATKHPHRRPHSHLSGFITADREMTGYDGSRDAFVGIYGSLSAPDAVRNGACTNTPGSSDATIGAMSFDLALKPGEQMEIRMLLGATDGPDMLEQQRKRLFESFDTLLEARLEEGTALSNRNHVQTPDLQLNRLLNHWFKQGTLFGATWCRWGWNGYRDIVQHGLGVSSFAPERTRAVLLQALRHQYSTGLALRGWNPVDDKPYSDSALWLVFTLCAWLKETGELNFLSEIVPWYDGGEATVLAHVMRALDFLEDNKGAHGLLLIRFGDWNDSLTAVGRDGKGESVWLSEAYAHALSLMAELYRAMGKTNEAEACSNRQQHMLQAIREKAWDGNWFLRCFDDNGQPVGGSTNKQGAMFIEAQAWALISGAADSQQTELLIKSCDAQLGTDLGYALLSPVFHTPEDRIGRISCLEPGVCENGTLYAHTNIWMILGFLQVGQIDRAWSLFQKIAPGYPTKGNPDPKAACPPYMTANCFFGADHRNRPFQMEFTWITGSLAWFVHVMQTEFLGIKPTYSGLEICPKLPTDWPACTVHRVYRNASYRIHITRSHEPVMVILLNGARIKGTILPLPKGSEANDVTVLLP